VREGVKRMTRIIERVEAHYESREVPFGKTYEWYPGHVVLKCDCGEEWTLTSTSATTRCRCGADHGAVVHDIREKEGRLRDNITHPWHHDTRERAEQHLRDEADHRKDSPWRYNDITAADDE
jgi:hypothetical protein